MKEKKNKSQDGLRHQLSKWLEVPPEVISDLPQIVLSGNKELRIENFGGLLEYTPQVIRLSTKCGQLLIHGVHLEAKKMTADYMIVIGNIIQVEFIV